MSEVCEAYGDSLRIFSGSSHRELAGEIAEYLGCPLCPSYTNRFSNDNLFVQLGESVRGKEVVVIQSFAPPVSDHMFELTVAICWRLHDLAFAPACAQRLRWGTA